MKGIEYFYDKDGEPKAVLIDLRRHGELWEDFQDLLVISQRKSEPTIPLEKVKERLRKNGKIP